jgi:hypothetical protein
MPIVSYLHQLFNAEACQSYIHTLRWKDRLLPVPEVSEPPCRSLGHLPLPAWTQTLPLSRKGLQAYLQ